MRLDGYFSGQKGCHPTRRCRLARELGATVQEAHPLGDLVLRDQDALDVVLRADANRVLACERSAETVCHRLRIHPHRLAGLEAAAQRVRELRLDRDDASPLGRESDARDETAAAD